MSVYKEKYKHLIGKIVRNGDCISSNTSRTFGVLEYIGKDKYPFILRFIGGSSYGVNSISDEQPIEDSILDIQLRNIKFD